MQDSTSYIAVLIIYHAFWHSQTHSTETVSYYRYAKLAGVKNPVFYLLYKTAFRLHVAPKVTSCTPLQPTLPPILFILLLLFFHFIWPPVEWKWIVGPKNWKQLTSLGYCINIISRGGHCPTIAHSCSYFVHLFIFHRTNFIWLHELSKWITCHTYFSEFLTLVYCIYTILLSGTIQQ